VKFISEDKLAPAVFGRGGTMEGILSAERTPDFARRYLVSVVWMGKRANGTCRQKSARKRVGPLNANLKVLF